MKTYTWEEMKKNLSPEVRMAGEAKARELMAEMHSKELHKVHQVVQANLAERLKIDQAAVSKVEENTDVYVDVLRDSLKKYGAALEINIRFNNEVVSVEHFHSLA